MKNASETTPSWSIHHLKSPVDGASIRYATIPSEEASYGILLLNGRSEWIEKYATLPDKLELGPRFLWATMDHRGQGGSEGERAHVASYDDFAQDAAEVARLAFGSRPYAIIAHSMGGLIGIYGSLMQHLHPKVTFLCSPLLGLKTPMPMIVARSLARIVASTRLGLLPIGSSSDRRQAFAGNILTSSYEGFKNVLTSPYAHAAPSFGWVNATFAALDALARPDLLKGLPCPVRILVGATEEVVDAAAYAPWVRLATQHSAQTVEWKRLGMGRHELLNEVESIERLVLGDIKSWFKAHWIL